MNTIMRPSIFIILTLVIISCNKSARHVILEVDDKKHELEFQRSTSSDIIKELGEGLHETEFVPIPDDKEGQGTIDERVYYEKLGLTFLLMTHEPTTRKDEAKQRAVIYSITLDSTSNVVMDGLRIRMTQEEIESYLGPLKRLEGPCDSTTFYYQERNILINATKDSTGQRIVKRIERIYSKSRDEEQH